MLYVHLNNFFYRTQHSQMTTVDPWPTLKPTSLTRLVKQLITKDDIFPQKKITTVRTWLQKPDDFDIFSRQIPIQN